MLPLLLAAALTAAGYRDQGVLRLDASPHAKMRSVPVRAVRMGEGFWAARMEVNAETSVPTMVELLEENGVMDALPPPHRDEKS